MVAPTASTPSATTSYVSPNDVVCPTTVSLSPDRTDAASSIAYDNLIASEIPINYTIHDKYTTITGPVASSSHEGHPPTLVDSPVTIGHPQTLQQKTLGKAHHLAIVASLTVSPSALHLALLYLFPSPSFNFSGVD
ncbi:hypothetical protein V6N13_047005 [Hibiscus sabdariffa]